MRVSVLISQLLTICDDSIDTVDAVDDVLWNLGRQMFLWVEEHSRANAELAVALTQNIYIHAPFAAAPECLVIGQVGEGDWLMPHVSI